MSDEARTEAEAEQAPLEEQEDGPDRNYRKEVIDHVTTHDLGRVFDLGGADSRDVLTELKNRAGELFGPLASRLEMHDSWVRAVWECGRRYGYVFDVPEDALTALDCGQVLERLETETETLSQRSFTWFYSGAEGHWNFAQSGGYGIKSVLTAGSSAGWDWDEGRYGSYRDSLNEAIEAIATFDPGRDGDCETFRDRLVAEGDWKWYPNLSVLFHLVWPQFFPVHYRKTRDGYSQIAGMNRLVQQIALRHGLRPGGLDLEDYHDYAAVYRLLLAVYDAFVYQDRALPRPTPHFDFLTQLLAEREGAEAEQLLLMKRALVLHGVPGTGKTHMARHELLPALVDKERVHRVQFHAGYSYADFMIGIRPKAERGEITYEVEPGILYRLAAEAAQALKKGGAAEAFGDGAPVQEASDPDSDGVVTHQDRRKGMRYGLLVDEINRADLARVFGEVLFCIESPGPDGSVQLPHTLLPGTKIESVLTPGNRIDDPFDGGRRFYLPENLYLVGTMNTADRSVGAFDAALRRRFAWYRLDFSATRLEQIMLERAGEEPALDLDRGDVAAFVMRAARLNELVKEGRSSPDESRQALPLSAEHAIGHTYFADIVPIMKRTGHGNGKISSLHLERLWLYFLEPLLEDALGFEAPRYRAELDELKGFFTKALP